MFERHSMYTTLVTLFFWAILGLIPASAHAESSLSLVQRITKYLNTTKNAEADRVLQEIRKDPDATIATIEKIFRSLPRGTKQKTGEQVHLPITVEGEEMYYALYVPKSYDPQRAYPLVLCLHGMGFTGDSYLERWTKRLGEKFLLACPTVAMGQWWTPLGEALVLAVLQEVVSQYHIDSNRIMLTGMSNGGIGAYLIGMHHADRFAAVSPMAGGIPNEIFPLLANFQQTGVYIIHGSKDQIMPVTLSREVNAYFGKIGFSVIYREHDKTHTMAGGHFFPREEVPALVGWFSNQQRDPYPKEIQSVRDIDHLNRFYWTKINHVSEDLASVYSSVLSHEEAGRVKEGKFAILSGKIHGNTIELETQRVQRLTLYLHSNLVDLTKPVLVIANGQQRFEGKVDPDISVLLQEARYRKDPSMLFEAKLPIEIPQQESPVGAHEQKK